MEYLSDSIMLEMLKKVQPLQADVLKTGRSFHLDASVNHSYVYGGDYINFGVTIFEGNEIIRDFDFSSTMSQEELDAEYACLAAYVNRIKKEAE